MVSLAAPWNFKPKNSTDIGPETARVTRTIKSEAAAAAGSPNIEAKCLKPRSIITVVVHEVKKRNDGYERATSEDK